MEKNVGHYDRWARWVIGGGLVVYGLKTKGWRRWLALTAGSNVLGTAATKKCLLNKALGVNTAEDSSGKDVVQEASEESFPASDAPSWNRSN